MTMLDRMRRHKGWLKWSLALVCLAFVVFYIPDFLTPQGIGAAPGDVVATVGDRTITVGDFTRVYRAQIQAMQASYGGAGADQLIRQLGIDQQILQQLIDEQAALAEAERLGITASDAEVRQQILSLPAFQENGQFIGEARYRQILQLQSPPLSVAQFEEQVRGSVLLQKLQAAVSEWITVSEPELVEAHRRLTESVTVQLVTLEASAFRDQVEIGDEDVAAYFGEHAEDYRIPERRRVRYLPVDVESLRSGITVPEAEIERTYNEQIEQYSTPGEMQASHILFSTEDEDEASVRARAETVLAQARSGADFAELAREYSDDEGSAAVGGDLGLFGLGRMVPEFEEAAFAMEPGEISDLVRTQFGFHIIKVVEKQESTLRPLEEVHDQIADQLAFQLAQTRAEQLASTIAGEIQGADDLERVAGLHGLIVQESGLFAASEPLAGLGFSAEASARAFTLADGEVSEPIRTTQGFGFITVTGREESRLPELEAVADQVRGDLTTERAVELSRSRAEELVTALRQADDFAQAAERAGFEVTTSEAFTRGAAPPTLNLTPEAEAAAFQAEPGTVSDPIVSDTSVTILKLVDRTEPTREEFEQAADGLRTSLLQERRNAFFTSYMNKVKEQMSIAVDQATLQSITEPA